MKKLLEIYGNKIVINVKEYYTDNYYYFYDGEQNVFGISKSITQKEYELLKLTYQEKKIYHSTNLIQKIYEYLFENKEYPFAKQRARFFIYQKDKLTNDTIMDMLEDIYKEIIIIEYKNFNVAFYFGLFDIPLGDLFISLSEDFSKDIYFHIGPYLTKESNGLDIVTYLDAYSTSICKNKGNSDVSDILFEANNQNFANLVLAIYNLVLKPIIHKSDYLNLITRLFKNDLNVSKTSKDLYLNRNSILAKIDNIEKETGINIQKFSGACTLKILLSMSNLDN